MSQGLFTGHDRARGPGQVGLKKPAGRVGSRKEVGAGNLTDRVGSGQEVFKYHGSGRDGNHPDPIRPARRDPTRENSWKNIRVD